MMKRIYHKLSHQSKLEILVLMKIRGHKENILDNYFRGGESHTIFKLHCCVRKGSYFVPAQCLLG